MKKFSFYCFILMSLYSCSPSLKNRTLYKLTSDILSIQEYEMKFITDQDVQIKLSLQAGADECRNYLNDPTILEGSQIIHYTYNNDILEIPDLKMHYQLTPDHDDFKTNTSDMFYNISIVEYLNTPEVERRVAKHLTNSTFFKENVNNINSKNDPELFKTLSEVNKYFDQH